MTTLVLHQLTQPGEVAPSTLAQVSALASQIVNSDANAELVSAATMTPSAPAAAATSTPWYSKKIAGNFTTGEAGILAVTAGVLWKVFA